MTEMCGSSTETLMNVHFHILSVRQCGGISWFYRKPVAFRALFTSLAFEYESGERI